MYIIGTVIKKHVSAWVVRVWQCTELEGTKGWISSVDELDIVVTLDFEMFLYATPTVERTSS